MTNAQPETQNPEPKPPSLLSNWISLLGIIVALCSFFTVLTLMVFDLLRDFANPYLGVLTYLMIPAVLIGGIGLTVIGVWWERSCRRRLAPGEILLFPRIDLNLPRQRNAFVAVVVIAFIFILLSAIGIYRTYHFSESVQFCGQLCHSVMKPEYTAYTNSPHARVTCTECHIGPGATWFVRSKLSGAYQVYATLVGKFPRPIPTPIQSLRPAQETCEQCHWPRKFFGAVERVRTHFLPDEKNSPWTIRLLLKVGGADPAHGPVGGIHWHMNVANKIEYIAKDEPRQVIPWVRVTDPEGRVRVYQSKEDKLTPDQIIRGPIRRMDCIDCHNRPTHIFQSPNNAVDTSLLLKRMDRAIPSVRKTAVEALVQKCDTEAEGLQKIGAKFGTVYATYKDQEKIRAAIAETQKIFRENFFPEMKSNWKAYPDNIGHLNWPGCYRCHDGEHVADDGKPISRDCASCHTIIAQGPGTELDAAAKGRDFQHPGEEVDKDMKCSGCHDGALVQ